jgi:hypothetical protein
MMDSSHQLCEQDYPVQVLKDVKLETLQAAVLKEW